MDYFDKILKQTKLTCHIITVNNVRWHILIEELNWETLNKDIDFFEISIQSKSSLRVCYKDNDQLNNLLV